MAHTYLCFLWHMHQPFYKDLLSGEYKLPWTRLHALKDYYGMVCILEDFPKIRQTFNLVPSMMAQVEEYAAGKARDLYLELSLKPAEALTVHEQEFLLQQFFHAYPQRMIYRYERYGELYDAREAQRSLEQARRLFGAQDYRDLQVLSQLAWFDEEYQAKDAEVKALIAKGRGYTPADQQLTGQKQREIVAAVIPAYQRVAARGQIEISTTPYYHPILPLLCDTAIASVSHPGVALPPRFRYPQDARAQLQLSRRYIAHTFGGAEPAGLWPSEGSVSDDALSLAADAGFSWAATDSGVLARTVGRTVGVEAIYRPYRWERDGRSIHLIFRDHFLSDLIGFVYSRLGAAEAAEDFLARIRANCRPILDSGRDALVPIILDGENAWEYYERNGRPFLRELYRRISADPAMSAVTIGEALSAVPAERLDHVFPGSWINANFDVWIGAEEDNLAWSHLLRARESYEAERTAPEERKKLAYEELLIAEGSDWCWWYGPEHDSAHRIEFDQLYRSHLANVYRALGRTPPEDLSRPILRIALKEVHQDPSGPISPVVDGEITSYFEWLGAGMYRVDQRSGSMHGKKLLVHEVQYGIDDSNFYVRIDFHAGSENDIGDLETRITAKAGERTSYVTLRLDHGRASATDVRTAVPRDGAVDCAFRKVLEARIALTALGTPAGTSLKFQFSIWQGGLPIDAVPQQGWLEVPPVDQVAWPA